MSAPDRRWPGSSGALLAGLLGGWLVGVGDGGATIATGAGTRSPLLLLVGGAAGALGGLAAAALLLVLAACARRLLRSADGAREAQALSWAAALLAVPVLWYDAFALFSGAKAARVPGNKVISVVLVALGLATIGWLARSFARLVADLETGRRAPRLGWSWAAAGALGAAAAYWANRHVLPRLYPWFHVTLGIVTLVLAVLAARLVIAGRRPPVVARLASRAGVAVCASAALLLGLAGGPSLLGNHVFRFAAFEKTLLAGMLLKQLPLPRPKRVVGRADRVTAADADRSPLPEGPRRPDADVVLITVDALRPDHLGAYGYGRNTTPHLDALAKQSVVFERAYAQAPHTSFSVASMLTGKYYPTIARLAPGDAHDPVTEILQRYNWKTAAFYPPAVFYVDADKLKAYQENNFGFEYVKVEYLDAFERLAQIDAFFEAERPAKAFLWLHLFEPHEPYDTRKGFEYGTTDVDRYDSEVAYADAAIGKIVAYLEAKRPGAIVIVTADHGEEFDEHKGRYHGTTLYEEQIRVPLIVRVPGVTPHRVEGQVELIDIAPTVLGMLDIPIPVRMRGTDLGPWIGHPPAPESRLPPAFAEVEDKRMVVVGHEKLICDLNWGYCAYHDLKVDPGEQKNLADERPERVAALKERLDDWLDDHGRFEPQLLRGLANPEGGAVPKAIERGRLGDLGAIHDLAVMLRSGEPLPVRREAARLLVTALPPKKMAKEPIFEALTVEDQEVRDWTSVAAVRLGHEGARGRLREIVTTDGAPRDLQIQAGLALADVGDAVGVPVLAASLDRCESVKLCRLVILALGKVKDRRAVPALLKHLGEVQNRREMVDALGEIADPSTTDPLLERLARDEYVPVRAQAAHALGRIKGERARAGLERALTTERERSVLDAIRAALDGIDGAPRQVPSAPKPRPGRAGSPRRAELR
jgi:arylsulfatase A-like enzyme/HEAT repeat protein